MHIRIGAVAFVVLLAAQVALADGMFIEPADTYGRLYGDLGTASTEQKGIIIEPAEGREVLLLQTTYHGPAAGFAWVVPVPGEPRENDVFIASSEFIAHVLDTTEPIVNTHIDIPRPPKMVGAEDDGMMMEPPGEAAAESVTLHRRMDVGDYDVSVLSATGPNVLVEWLNDNGYATPEGHADVFDHYVGKGWFFVALRVQPGVVEEKPVLNDVKPIGISFWCDDLVYPLHISRGSSREKTALTLVTLSREPMECEQLKRARLPLGDHGTGTSYARIRRETIEAQSEPSAIVEYAGYHGVWQPHISWRDGAEENLSSADMRNLWATRLWTILDRDEMEDLSFARADVRGERVTIDRTGKLPGPPWWQRVRASAWLVGGALFLLLGVLRIGARRIPLPLLYAALSIGAAAVCLPGLPRWLQPWMMILCLLATFLTVPIVAGCEKRPREDEPRYGMAVYLWTLLTMGWVAAAGMLARQGGGRWLAVTTGLPLFLLLVAVMLVVFYVRPHRLDATAHLRALPAMLLAAGFLVYFSPLRPHLPSSFESPIMDVWLMGGIAMAVLLLAAYVTLAVARRGRGIAGWEHIAIVVFGLAVGAIVVWVAGGELINVRWLGPSASRPIARVPLILAVSVLFGYAWASLRLEGGLGNAARTFALTLLLLGAGMSLGRVSLLTTAHAGSVSVRHSGLAELDRALTQLDDAILAFLEDAGCYPASLEDLTVAVPPESGVDSSGNKVPAGRDWLGSRIKQLPEDPLTGRSDTWVYEVTGSPMIDSGGLAIELSTRETRGRYSDGG